MKQKGDNKPKKATGSALPLCFAGLTVYSERCDAKKDPRRTDFARPERYRRIYYRIDPFVSSPFRLLFPDIRRTAKRHNRYEYITVSGVCKDQISVLLQTGAARHRGTASKRRKSASKTAENGRRKREKGGAFDRICAIRRVRRKVPLDKTRKCDKIKGAGPGV